MNRDAVISPCGRYRYFLSRQWDEDAAHVCWVMLNPSTADADVDDATIRKCCGYARRWGLGGIDVVNLFAWRATDPATLPHVGFPVGDGNDNVILARAAGAILTGGMVVCAWGANRMAPARGRHVVSMLRSAGVAIRALRFTKSGQPCHPLYLPGSLEPSVWE